MTHDNDNDLNPELEQTLDEHIRWVNQATELAIAEGPTGIKKEIDALEDDQLRGMIFVLITTRAGDVQYLRERVKDNIPASSSRRWTRYTTTKESSLYVLTSVNSSTARRRATCSPPFSPPSSRSPTGTGTSSPG